jgi:signal transduction histidine kinase
MKTVFNDSVPQFLETDPVKLQQRVNDLISNAIKVFDESKVITVSVDFRSQSLQVLVADTTQSND